MSFDKENLNVLEKTLVAYSQKDNRAARAFMDEFFAQCEAENADPFPDDLEENPSLWYEIMIDTGLFSTPSGSPARRLFEKAAKHKFDEIPEEIRQGFIDGLDKFFPASDV